MQTLPPRLRRLAEVHQAAVREFWQRRDEYIAFEYDRYGASIIEEDIYDGWGKQQQKRAGKRRRKRR